MNKEHVISDEVLDKAHVALSKGENWMVYNNSLYFIEPDNVDFFRTKEEAREFCVNNHSDYDCVSTLHIQSLSDVIKHFPYGEAVDNNFSHTRKMQSLPTSGERSSYELYKRNLDGLKNQLNKLGFSERLIPAIEFYLKKSEPHFQLLEREISQNEKMQYILSFEENLRTNQYLLKEYEATLSVHPEISDITIETINCKELDGRMKTVDWSIDHHAESLVYDYVETQEGREFLDKLDAILKDIDNVYQSNGIGKEVAERLMYKHWYGEPWQPNTLSLEHLRQNYEWKKIVNVEENKLQTKPETYKQLKEAALKDLKQVNKYSFTNQSFVMNEKNYEFLIDQLKKTGFGETFDNVLREKMEHQAPEFTLNMTTNFGKDNIIATLHFKRSEQSDMFFFNKYELQLKKQNSENDLKNSFYINKGNTITLKEGYNLLDGRAVHKTLTNKQNEKFNAWIQLDLTHKNEKGNYEPKQFHQNYGFDLEKTLGKYPIKELGNDKFKESLIKSLEKGNLQSATFLVNGKEEKIYLAANPAFKSLNAYDSEMKRVSLSNLIQKNALEQSQKQETKPELRENKQVKKQNKVEKQDENKPAKKRQKQKVG